MHPHIVTSRDGGQFVVKGDRVSLVSVEQAERVGVHPRDDVKMPSDVVLPKDFVLLHDPSGKYMRKCDFYVLHVSSSGTKRAHIDNNTLDVARHYYGDEIRLAFGSVDIPKKSWQRVAEVKFIRYRRKGERRGHFEHAYEVPVWLYDTTNPLAWRVALPVGCVVDARGFVWP